MAVGCTDLHNHRTLGVVALTVVVEVVVAHRSMTAVVVVVLVVWVVAVVEVPALVVVVLVVEIDIDLPGSTGGRR